MKKLTIGGKPIVIWMETQADVDKAISIFKEIGSLDYVEAKSVVEVRAAVLEGLVPLITCPIDDMQTLLDHGQAVLFCIRCWNFSTQGGDNPLKHKLYRLRMLHTGLVAFGESPNLPNGERTVWGIPHQHAMNFAEFGYS